jgi:hypothetical protein
MKKAVQKILASIGYKIERINNPNPLSTKYKRLIAEMYSGYQFFKFQSLPDVDYTNVELMANLDGTQISEAIYILESMQQTSMLDGDICEFGVAQGYTSALLAYNIKDLKKEIWLFDSFKGLPAPTENDKLKDDIFNLKNIESYQGTMKHSQQLVLNNLKSVNFSLNRVNIIDGFIEDTISTAKLPSQVSFAYVDFDFYNPIKVALDFLDGVLVSNGIILVDDYDFFSEGAKIAVDEFYSARKETYSIVIPPKSIGRFAVLKKI